MIKTLRLYLINRDSADLQSVTSIVLNEYSCKKIILSILVGFLLISCKKEKENETASNLTITSKVDTLTTSTSKDIVSKDSTEVPTDNKDCIQKTSFELPYSQKIDVNKIKYTTTNCTIEGIDELLCDNSALRYISLPNFENRKVVLIPVDCGDFNYRFYLATIFENKLLSKLYVEGEWYEPGNESYKELSSFSIDEDYKITVTQKQLKMERMFLQRQPIIQ